MDERMLDAICEHLKPALCTDGTCLVREGDPVNEMLFIIRGRLDSYTTNGGRTGFFNSIRIGPSEFYREELLTWALDPRPGVILPSSTRTVKAISEVEAFALIANDLKFVTAQFRRLHNKQLRHKVPLLFPPMGDLGGLFHTGSAETASGSGELPYAARLAASTRRSGAKMSGNDSDVVSSLQKPAEPDFTAEEED